MPSTGRCRAGLRATCAGWSGGQRGLRGEGKGGMGSAAQERAAFLILGRCCFRRRGGEGWGPPGTGSRVGSGEKELAEGVAGITAGGGGKLYSQGTTCAGW